MRAPTLSTLERVVGHVAPGWARRHFERRIALETSVVLAKRWGLGGGYEGGRIDSRTKGWYAPTSDAASAGAGLLELLRARSHDLVRNNEYAGAAIEEIADEVVGEGIRPQAIAESREEAERVEAGWREWAESTACDADGREDFYGLQVQVMRSVVESGSVLIRRRLRRPEDAQGLPSALQLQLLEPDHLDHSKSEGRAGNVVLQGVEFDGIGRRVAYWLFPDHPGASTVRGGSGFRESVRVPASEVQHVFRTDRVGQVDGVPWGAAAIIRLRNLDEYEDAELVRKRLAACFTAFVLGAGDGPARDAEGARLAESLEPGLIQYLRDGEAVEFASPPDSAGYGEYVDKGLRAVAVAYGVPYERLTGDLSKVNFSSGRMGGNAFNRRVRVWRRRILVPQMLNPSWRWWAEAAYAAGQVERPVHASWTAPGHVMVDPAKEGKADHEAIRNGTKTLFQVIRERGGDPDEHLREIARGNELLDELELKLDSDPRNAAAPGAGPGAKEEDDEEKPEPEDREDEEDEDK